MRPHIVGAALQKIGQDPEVAKTMFEVLETEQMLANTSDLTYLPREHELLRDLLVSTQEPGVVGQPPGRR
jgi:hypothetical protein